MTEERAVTVEGKTCQITISDEHEALLAAYAAGRAVIGVWDKNRADQCLKPADYVIEPGTPIEDEFLERVVRRRLGLAWIITVTDRLMVREFCMEDLPYVVREEDDRMDDKIFQNEDTLAAYIKHQYGFFEYGIWAVVERNTGKLIGKVGFSNLNLDLENNQETSHKKEDTPVELGYHIFSAYRRQGYAKEACREILKYASAHISDHIYARIDPENEPSVNLAEDLGFHFISERYNESFRYKCLYEWNCS